MQNPTHLTIWFGAAASERVTAPAVSIDADGGVGTDDASGPGQVHPRQITVVASRRGRAVGALLVPGDLASEVALNGARVGVGLHALRHADRIDVAGHASWVSADTEPIESTYDPARHGDDQRCLRTKARLAPGEEIVVCPGTPAVACGSLFKRAAWRPTLRCHQCGFDPRGRRWRPAVRQAGARLAQLLALTKGATMGTAKGASDAHR